MSFQGVVLALFSLSLHAPIGVEGHGYLLSPRSRNAYAHPVIGNCLGQAGCPPEEYCPHCLNDNTGVCGKSFTGDYETSTWLDKTGDPMPWHSQHRYLEGEIMIVESYLDTNHNGHQELWACAMDDNDPTMCSEPEHFEGKELHFVRELVTEGSHMAMPPDPHYPERGMYGGGQSGGRKRYSHEFRLPEGVSGDRVLLRWKYITANACSPPGYSNYFSENPNLPDSYWSPGLQECTPPYPEDGARGPTYPEQFFNCAEISVIPRTPTIDGPTPPPVAPPTPPTNPPLPPTNPPGMPPSPTPPTNPPLPPTNPSTNPPGMPPSPTPPTNPPLPPTNPPVMPPSPTPPPDGPTDACCSINLKTCHHPEGTFCAYNRENCEGPCGKIWLPDGPLDNCTALWEGPCSTDADCCQHGECREGQCNSDDPWEKVPTNPPTPVPTPAPTPAPTCTLCDDRETTFMINRGRDCATETILINRKCNKDAIWRQNKWCRLSCYNAGYGYPGDVCCGPATADTLGRELAAASGATKRAAFPPESQYLE